jgi:hypothetical protein
MKMLARAVLALTAISTAIGASLLNAQAPTQTLSGNALLKTLRQGGYVIVMRHASSAAPGARQANGQRGQRHAGASVG